MTKNNLNISYRAGRYIQQPSGYRAFIPSALPPDPPLSMDSKMMSLVSKADRALGRLDGSIQTLPDANLFVFMYVRKEAVLSSQIEGTQSSLDDVLEAEAMIFRRRHSSDVEEVINYIHALNQGIKRLEELPVSVRLLREIHKLLLKGVRGAERQPGELRTTQNWVGPAGSTISDAVFIPPPPQEVPQCLSGLEKFIHSDTPDMPALIKIGMAHAQLETIHPFLDGNGRIGRLLIALLLCDWKILQKPVLYISHYFKKHREQYYELLQAVRDRGDWEGWLKFFLTAVAEVASAATETARRIVYLRERDRSRIVGSFGRSTANGLKVLESLYSKPIISINDIIQLTGLSFTAASQLMSRFLKHNILREYTGQKRNRLFRYEDYIAIFKEN
ncbi:adenosine monophosphate-protein transferase SoFic [bacterium BMS3Abin07]|nr:adenosine monophosphate-protein transferase SoFic [bacterium BMS3Abin07]GBE31618.1 adenosine monophosphate-protein transferase SoFic [bacterium BMS3Bbin05]HDO21895.1 Fic family protein [Nitrospirota bacterium]HDZ87330.1 Fic family protein [Nitrospirota bacterium]